MHVLHIEHSVRGRGMVGRHDTVRGAAQRMVVCPSPYVVVVGKLVCDRRRALWWRIVVHRRCRALSGTQVSAKWSVYQTQQALSFSRCSTSFTVEAEVEERVTGTKTIYAVAVVSAVNDGCGSVGSPRTM